MKVGMSETSTTIDGSAQAEISRRLVQIMKEQTGRGPTRTRTTVSDDLVVCLMRAGFTTAERTLVSAGLEDTVHRLREGIQQSAKRSMVAVVETVTGRAVTAFMSANHVDPDIGVEVVLLKPLDGEPGIAAA
jgi:uncharacterized protein YbcI